MSSEDIGDISDDEVIVPHPHPLSHPQFEGDMNVDKSPIGDLMTRRTRIIWNHEREEYLLRCYNYYRLTMSRYLFLSIDYLILILIFFLFFFLLVIMDLKAKAGEELL